MSDLSCDLFRLNYNVEDIISRSVIDEDHTALSGRCSASGCECLTPLSGPGSGSRCQNSGSECQSQLRPGQGSQAPEPEPVGASLPIRQYAETGGETSDNISTTSLQTSDSGWTLTTLRQRINDTFHGEKDKK